MTATALGRIRHLAVLALVIGLTGCFKSSAPLIDASNSKFPFKTITLKAEDGEIEILKREGDVYKRTEDGKPSEEPLLLHEISDGIYIVQETPKDGDTTYLFAKRDGNNVVVRGDCHGIAPDTLKRLNFDVQDESKGLFYECHAKDLNGLIGLGKLPDIWSEGTQTLQIQAIE